MSEEEKEILENHQEVDVEGDLVSTEEVDTTAETEALIEDVDMGEIPQEVEVSESMDDSPSLQEEIAVPEDIDPSVEISDEQEQIEAVDESSPEGEEAAPVAFEVSDEEAGSAAEIEVEAEAEGAEEIESLIDEGEQDEELPVAEVDVLDEPSAELDVELGEELVTAPVHVEEPDDGRLWYVVHCYSGYENKVRHNLEQRIETMGMKAKIFDVVVPTEEEIEIKDGKRRTVERRVFPGYILVQMIMDEDSWYVVRNTPGVTGFVGMGNEPTPLRPEEVSQIVRRMEADAPRIKVTYRLGQKVRIIDGPFNDFIGTVADIDMERAKVRVMVSFFGRETPVELDFLQVEKA
jgi:transcriptional antiterminator NusG